MSRTHEYVRRLRREFALLSKEPVPHITARPSEKNILVWYYVLEGHKDSPYRGGVYLGKLRFPPEYPHKPPSIYMLTPNGRFKPNTRLCLSMSDYHPETWNPLWSVGSILTGLESFMLQDERTAGSTITTTRKKRELARASMKFNLKQRQFKRLFPEIVEKYKDLDAIFAQIEMESPCPEAAAPRASSVTADVITMLLAVLGVLLAYHFYTQ